MLNLSYFLGSVAPGSPLANECYVHFSQGGEDIVIDQLLSSESSKGLLVDIGSYHPVKFSNTFLLYLQGWRGVNVDGNRESIEIFKMVRPEDVNIHALVSDKVETLSFYRFNEGAWNTTNEEAVKILTERNRVETTIASVEKMQTVPIMEILDTHVGTQKFDLLTIDVEGMDVKILEAIDFNKYRPKVIALEIGPDSWLVEPLKSFLVKSGYSFYAQCVNTSILRRND